MRFVKWAIGVEHQLVDIGTAIGTQQAVKQQAFLKRGKRIGVLDAGRAERRNICVGQIRQREGSQLRDIPHWILTCCLRLLRQFGGNRAQRSLVEKETGR